MKAHPKGRQCDAPAQALIVLCCCLNEFADQKTLEFSDRRSLPAFWFNPRRVERRERYM
jgi:hypothetical protein